MLPKLSYFNLFSYFNDFLFDKVEDTTNILEYRKTGNVRECILLYSKSPEKEELSVRGVQTRRLLLKGFFYVSSFEKKE